MSRTDLWEPGGENPPGDPTAHCWDAAYDGGPSVVEVTIHRLRRKIEAGGGPLLIETVRGEGYVIRAEEE